MPRIRKGLVLLGARIRALRHQQGLSKEELAARSGIHPTYLSSLEAGKRNPSALILFSLAAALRITPAKLLDFRRSRRAR